MRHRQRLNRLRMRHKPERPIAIRVCWNDEEIAAAEAEAAAAGEQLIVIRYVDGDDWRLPVG